MQLIGAQRRYGSGSTAVAAVRDVDLSIASGDFVALMGSSGSGKSTLLQILGLLDRLDAGRYLLCGDDVSYLRPDARAARRLATLGFVFQSFHLLPRTAAWENVALPLVYAGVAPKQRRARALGALARVGLQERAQHTPAQLSGGQQQRVAIARALVTEPAVLLADEPTGNLDSATSMAMMDLFGALHREGLTIVMVTHEPEVAACAQRIVVVRDGRIVDAQPAPEAAATGGAAEGRTP
jgi:putative ABC transport system ATP-binding protein